MEEIKKEESKTMNNVIYVDQCWHCLKLSRVQDLKIEHEYTVNSHEELVRLNQTKKLCKECVRVFGMMQDALK